MKKSRLEEINNNFSSIISFISTTHPYVSDSDLEFIDYIQYTINKYKGDYLFIGNSIMSNLQQIVNIISCNSGHEKRDVEEEYIRIAKEIIEEYNILITELKS